MLCAIACSVPYQVHDCSDSMHHQEAGQAGDVLTVRGS